MGEFAYPHQISIGQYDHHYLESSAKRCHSIWDAANAQFSPCALPFLSAIPLVVIILVTLPLPLSHISRIRKWRPEWTKPFIRESKQHNSDLTVRQQNQTLFWSFSLLTWSTLAIAAQIIKLRLLESGLPAILLLIAWVCCTHHDIVDKLIESRQFLLLISSPLGLDHVQHRCSPFTWQQSFRNLPSPAHGHTHSTFWKKPT